jgi:transposase InsO family protein
MFDVINSLGDKQRDFLIHARLAHLPRKAILQLIKNGAKGLPYKGKFKELCRPCLEAHQRAENHGKQTTRHPNGKIGEHLHSDLAVVNLADFNGYKYVLTVVDEISDEIVIALLKTKKAEIVLNACKRIHKIIVARTKKQLKTWQFDRGSEFMNKLFDEWITCELGATQMFSNIEHPWENGRAERSFGTIFQKARAMIKYADLPNGIWGRALIHSAYLKNRSPSTRLNYLSPLQFRTKEPQDFTKLRVFGCPAQIFIRATKRGNNKLSDRSEKGIFIGMSRNGNGFIFRVKRTNTTCVIDSKDAKFNETFSDCRDRQGKIIKGGKVLDPDLINEIEKATNIQKAVNRFEDINRFENLEDNDKDESIDDNEDNDKDESIDDNEGYNDNESSSDSGSDDEMEFSERKNKPFEIKNLQPFENKKRYGNIQPIKTKEKISRTLKSIQASSGFQAASSNKSNDQSNSNTGKRTRQTRDLYEPNFLPTYKRNEATLFFEEENDDLTDLDPNEHFSEQMLSCLEQNIGKESGKLNDPEEDLMKSLQDIGRPDPKSQKAIDLMPEHSKKRYNDATRKEYEGMKAKDVMEFVRMTEIPKGAKIYICIVNWVTKYVLGKYQKTKCRICFGGHHYVKTFTDCFAPTVNFCSVLIMLCLAAMFGWFVGSLDYSQAYLNANIDEECYLRAPEFLREYDNDNVEFIWRLKKVIYGHPKGSRLWAECLDNKLNELGFKKFSTDQCVYGKWIDWDLKNLSAKSYFVFVLVHSDDLIIMSNLKDMMLQEKEKLLSAFEGVDQGTLRSFCGVEIDISASGIFLSMNYYWTKVMERFKISKDQKADKPLKTKINKTDCPETTNEERKNTYLQIIGSIIFGFTHCRLDLAFPIGMLTRVMHSPSETHLKQLIDLLKYINATANWGLNYFRDYTVKYGMDFIFLGYCDSSHGDDLATFRSTGGYFFFLRKGQACISSKSGQTPDVALSSTEAETIWACCAATQGAFIKQFLDELKIFGKTSFELMEDSQPAINAQKKNVSQSRFRHIKIKWHYIRQLLSEGWCTMVKINTKNQIADMATKILTSDTVRYFSNIVLGSVDVDQSLHVHGNDAPYNDWGVVSEPSYLSS